MKERSLGIVVHADAENGAIFEVRVLTTPNNLKLMTASRDDTVLQDLSQVMQPNISSEDDNCGSEREHNTEGTFLTYGDASKWARQVLLDANDNVSKERYGHYDEVAPGEKDCGCGENMLVLGVGTNGENVLISGVLGQVLESAWLAEAAMRIR
jgi:hypothetical protein